MSEFSSLLVPVLRAKLPEIANEAMAALASTDEVQDSPLLQAVVGIASDLVEEHGPQGASDLLSKIEAAVKSERLADLGAVLTAEQMTRLADAYQSAEAEDRKVAKRYTALLARGFGRFARLVTKAVVIAAVG